MIVQGYKYHNNRYIAKEQDIVKSSTCSSVTLFSYHCIQFGLEMAIMWLIIHNYLWAGKC